MATRMLQRRATAAEWAAANPVLGDGEIGFERDTKLFKIGDGTTAYASLPAYIRSDSKAPDSNLLDGLDSTQFMRQVLFDAKGDILIGTGPDTLAVVPVGGNRRVLTADSSTASGVAWTEPVGFAEIFLHGGS